MRRCRKSGRGRRFTGPGPRRCSRCLGGEVGRHGRLVPRPSVLLVRAPGRCGSGAILSWTRNDHRIRDIGLDDRAFSWQGGGGRSGAARVVRQNTSPGSAIALRAMVRGGKSVGPCSLLHSRRLGPAGGPNYGEIRSVVAKNLQRGLRLGRTRTSRQSCTMLASRMRLCRPRKPGRAISTLANNPHIVSTCLSHVVTSPSAHPTLPTSWPSPPIT